jgi:hypothetical protein
MRQVIRRFLKHLDTEKNASATKALEKKSRIIMSRSKAVAEFIK